MPKPGKRGGQVLAITVALWAFMILGHFLAKDLAVEGMLLEPLPLPQATWSALQVYFDECLEEPVPLAQWRGAAETGVVVVMAAADAPEAFELVRCFEVEDMAGSTGSKVAEVLPVLENTAGQERELLVTACGTGQLDEPSRRRFAQEFRAQFGLPEPE